MTDKPSCSTCPYMRFEGNSMRCYYEPPLAQVLGTVPSRIAGGPPQLIIAGISPEVHPDRFCRHHPSIEAGAVPEIVGAAEPVRTNGIIMPGTNELQ